METETSARPPTVAIHSLIIDFSLAPYHHLRLSAMEATSRETLVDSSTFPNRHFRLGLPVQLVEPPLTTGMVVALALRLHAPDRMIH